VPLIIEDGTGSDPTANSYAARADIIDYAAARGVTLADDATTDILAIAAMDYLESKDWKGDRVLADQPLSWPRGSVVITTTTSDVYGSFPTPVFAPSDTVPVPVKNAQCELAMQAKNGVNLMPVRAAGQLIKAEKLDVIETEYFETGGLVMPILLRVDALLKPFLKVGFGPLAAVRA
jgi:hypothetical protein